MVQFGRLLPELRRRLRKDLKGDSLERPQVLACAVRLLDVGLFRIGSEEYAAEEGGLGLATMRKEHVTLEPAAATFDYLGKGGIRRRHIIYDPLSLEVIRALKRRRSGGPHLLAYR